ncbi:MAG TPA: ChbG/HpnK family deacetylase [Fimbriimonas sp.]
MIRLITRGDDAGSCESADLALVECARAGILKNVGVMVPGPSFDHAVAMLKDLDGIDLGLHVTLNAEWDTVKWGPVLPPGSVPSLVDGQGNFTPTPNHLQERGIDPREAIDEVKAQLEKARKAGLEIHYLDEHMGVGWLGFRDGLARLCEQEGLVDHARFRYLGGAATAEQLLEKMSEAEPGTYVFVNHPGRDAEDMRRLVHAGLEPGQVARERELDRRLWLDSALAAAVREGRFEPIRYSDASTG